MIPYLVQYDWNKIGFDVKCIWKETDDIPYQNGIKFLNLRKFSKKFSGFQFIENKGDIWW